MTHLLKNCSAKTNCSKLIINPWGFAIENMFWSFERISTSILSCVVRWRTKDYKPFSWICGTLANIWRYNFCLSNSLTICNVVWTRLFAFVVKTHLQTHLQYLLRFGEDYLLLLWRLFSFKFPGLFIRKRCFILTKWFKVLSSTQIDFEDE